MKILMMLILLALSHGPSHAQEPASCETPEYTMEYTAQQGEEAGFRVVRFKEADATAILRTIDAMIRREVSPDERRKWEANEVWFAFNEGGTGVLIAWKDTCRTAFIIVPAELLMKITKEALGVEANGYSN